MPDPKIDRRNFIQGATMAGAAAQIPAQKKMIGIQVGAISFLDEGVEQVLDIFQQRANVNTLFLAVFTYGRGVAGRQVPGQPLPDHGKQEYDLNFHGGNFATPHPQYYKDTALKAEDTRAPDYPGVDTVSSVLPAAKKRGIRTILWAEDVFRNDLPNIDKLQEYDVHGRRGARLCFNNDIDGIMWCS